MRPLDQIGLVRKLEKVHKQVGGFMIFKAVNKMEVIWTMKRLGRLSNNQNENLRWLFP